MSNPLASYTFLPWLRQGLANNIIQKDGDAVKLRASIPVDLTIKAEKVDDDSTVTQTVSKKIDIYGPGDIIGIDSKAIIKSEPRNYIVNFEPNYFPYIDFYEEDFPWRYTPARADENRLNPWLTLVVLKESEFDENKDARSKPLPSFKLKGKQPTVTIFPKYEELWAWAHVHVNTDLSNGQAPGTVSEAEITKKIGEIIKNNPDHAYSRIVSPRKLDANESYHAFLIPTYESGRLAGLGGFDPNIKASLCSWNNRDTVEFPYYHRWYFRTGNVGDFEYLVNLLEPKLADKSIGVRDMDVLHPGANIPAITDPKLNGILKLGGALRVPFDSMLPADKEEAKKFDEWDEGTDPSFVHPFVAAMADRVNLADDYLNENSSDPDPVITSPLYGRWHALQKRLLKDQDNSKLPFNKNWVHELNLDPRFRVSAGIGTKVIQKKQEKYMQASWEQVGKVIEANEKIRGAQLAKEVSNHFYLKHLVPLLPERAFVLTAPLQTRLVYNNFTVYKQVEESIIPNALTSGAFRSLSRPRGQFMKKLEFTDGINSNNLIERVNNGEVVVVEPKGNPDGGITLDNLSDSTQQAEKIPEVIADLLKKYNWFKFLPLLILLLLILIFLLFFGKVSSSPVFVAIALGLIWLYRKFTEWDKSLKNPQEGSILGDQTAESIDQYPKMPEFTISEYGAATGTYTQGVSDSYEAAKFKEALKDVYAVLDIKYAQPERKKIDMAAISSFVIQSINPQLTIPKRTLSILQIPAWILANMKEKFVPVMVEPVIDFPMYRPLADLSSDLFLPNINKIEQNSITLLENNQKFIESYMVGLNHEMSRELLWREYPTDQRGSYFRQFWDVASSLPVANEVERDKLRDIKPIHLWHKTSNGLKPDRNELGQHNKRAEESGKTQLVLVIRGELLKKYPTAAIYAQKADWGTEDGKTESPKTVTAERVLVKLDPSLSTQPTSLVKMPLFEAKVDPDIFFLGFDLDDEEARGTLNPTKLTDDPGWFFVIKERPGEPRFGLDIDKAKNEAGEEKIINWNNLSWEDVPTNEGNCLQLLNKSIEFDSYNETKDQENVVNTDDKQAKWNSNIDSAQLAYILYQVPVLVGVHASRMLPK